MAHSMTEQKRAVRHPLFGNWFPVSLVDDLFDQNFAPLMRTGFEAHLDLSEKENEFQIKVDLPGVSPEEVDIRIDKNTLTISGERSSEKESDPDSQYHRLERISGKFSRTVVLPGPVDEENASASFESGVLKINIPKAAGSKPRRIDIK